MRQRRFLYLALLCLGFAEALPLPLMGSTVSIWLTEEGFSKQIIGFFSLLAIPFSLKIVWSPVVDRLVIPFFRREPRKGWVLASMWGIILSILSMSFLQPHENPVLLAFCILILSLCTGCLFIVGLSYELESLPSEQYGKASGFVHMGYRLGIAAAGAGVLYISYTDDWALAFRLLSLFLIIGSILIFFLPEPEGSQSVLQKKREALSQYSSFSQGLYQELFFQPAKAFLSNSTWKLILGLILVFKVGDQLMTSMKGPFYLSLGFDKIQLAQAAKIFGLLATLIGAYIGAFFQKGKDPFICLVFSGLLHSLSLLSFGFLSFFGASLAGLYTTVGMENITGAMAMSVFIRCLWSSTDSRYAATQYALLWSLFSFKGNLISFLGGLLAQASSWTHFFIFVSILSIGASLLSLAFVTEKRRRECLDLNR